MIPFKTMLPVFAVFWGWLFIGETFHPEAIKGSVLILAGAVMVTWKGKNIESELNNPGI